jgi:hypothetical protein
MRADKLPTLPDSLSELSELDIAYRSPLARAQRMVDLNALDQYTNRVLQMVQATQKPELLDVVNWELAARLASEYLGVDPSVVPDDAAVKQVRYKRQREQEAAAQAQQQAAAAQATGQGLIDGASKYVGKEGLDPSQLQNMISDL